MIRELIASHRFFVKNTPSFVGIKKEDKTKPIPVWGYHTDCNQKPFSSKNKVWGIVGIKYETYFSLSLKHRLYYPIAYIKFMYFSIKDR